jgi:RimJ/RimL family protein N-acetyltransferase
MFPSSLPEPTKVQVAVEDHDAIEWAISRGMRLLELRSTPAGHFVVLEKFDDAAPEDGFPLIAGGRLTGDGFHLRYMRPDDTEMIYQCETDSESQRWALSPRPSVESIRDMTRRGYTSWRLTQRSALTIVLDDGTPAGLIKIRKLVPPGVADVGYEVHRDFRRRGLATKALTAVCEWAASIGLFHRFELGIKPANVGSIRVAERAGFAFEGRRSSRLTNLDGSFSDELHYARVISARVDSPLVVVGAGSTRRAVMS